MASQRVKYDLVTEQQREQIFMAKKDKILGLQMPNHLGIIYNLWTLF